MNPLRWSALTLGTLLIAACATPPPGGSPGPGTGARPNSGGPGATAGPRPGRYYLDDGPGDAPPADLAAIPDARPRLEPLHRWANRPYVVFDRQYVPMTRLEPFRERGIGSWYGRKFHGQRTASGEVYDMYAMTAAHPTLPIPSYARVTHTRSGRTVVVRVNDRGPFLQGRVIDLSWTAAAKLGYAQGGSGEVEVELLVDPAGDVSADAIAGRAGAAASAPLALMAIADTPQRGVPVAAGSGAPAAAVPAAAGAAPPGAAPPGAATPGAGGAASPPTSAPVPQTRPPADTSPPERLDVETVIAPQPPRPARVTPPANPAPAPAPAASEGTAPAAAPAAPSAAAAAAAPSPSGAASAIPGQSSAAAGAALPPGQGLYLQIGAFGQRDNALAARSRAAAVLGIPVERIQLRPGEGALIRVLAGPFQPARRGAYRRGPDTPDH